MGRFDYWNTILAEGYSRLAAAVGVVALAVAVPPVATLGFSPWVFAVIVLAVLLYMLAEGAYRLHRTNAGKRQEALERVSQQQQEIHALRSAPRGGTGIHIEGGHGNLAWDNKVIYETPESTPSRDPEPAPEAIEEALRRRQLERPNRDVEPPST